jgi:hypothetical protein
MRQSYIHRIYGIDIGSTLDRTALCLDHKPVSLLHVLDTVLLICGRQIFPFFTDGFFHLFDIVSSVSLLWNPELHDPP